MRYLRRSAAGPTASALWNARWRRAAPSERLLTSGTWLRHFDEDDLAEFVSELRQTLSLAYHDDDLSSLVDAVAEWKATADELAEPARREVLLGAVDAADVVEVARPERHR